MRPHADAPSRRSVVAMLSVASMATATSGLSAAAQTPMGKSLQAPFAALHAWALDHAAQIGEAQFEYD